MSDIYNNYATSLYKQGDLEEAKDALKQAINQNIDEENERNLAGNYQMLTNILLDLENYNEAKKIWGLSTWFI